MGWDNFSSILSKILVHLTCSGSILSCLCNLFCIWRYSTILTYCNCIGIIFLISINIFTIRNFHINMEWNTIININFSWMLLMIMIIISIIIYFIIYLVLMYFLFMILILWRGFFEYKLSAYVIRNFIYLAC